MAKKRKSDDEVSQIEQDALDAIDAVFSDTSVSVSETKARMRNLISEIQMKLASLSDE